MKTTRAAAIDIGTNSVLLTVAERRPQGIVPLLERATITRLGEGVDQHGSLSAAAMERTLACLEEYARALRELGSPPLRVVGTSAMRDASGGDAFREAARELLGVTPEVISGDLEAKLTYRGALSGLPLGDDAQHVVVFDVGGGSTELIFAHAGVIRWCQSLDIGCVRLTERLLVTDPPTPAEQAAARALIRSALQALPALSVSSPDGLTLVGVAGTLTTLAAVAHGIAPYDAERVHGARLSTDQMASLTARLSALTTLERAALPGLPPKRADVIPAGSLIACEVARWAGASSCIISDRGVRWGVLHELLL